MFLDSGIFDSSEGARYRAIDPGFAARFIFLETNTEIGCRKE
jgi:hypothetical protein